MRRLAGGNAGSPPKSVDFGGLIGADPRKTLDPAPILRYTNSQFATMENARMFAFQRAAGRCKAAGRVFAARSGAARREPAAGPISPNEAV